MRSPIICFCLLLAIGLVTGGLDAYGRNVEEYTQKARETFVYFLHVPKSGGTYTHCIASSAGMQLPPHHSNDLYCVEYYKHWCPGGLNNERRVPFWSWPEEAQVSFFSSVAQPSNFVENEAGLGEEMMAPETLIAGKQLKYLLILRDPLDRAVSNFMFMAHNHRLTLEQWSQRISHRNPAFEPQMLGADMNKVTQMIAGWKACGDKTPNDEEPLKAVVCNRTALEAAKQRVAQMQVVIVLEWMHLSGPLLCREFGWCAPDVLDDVAVPGDACGGRETLEAAGLHGFVAELEHRFQVDRELYEHARDISRRQLAAVGVEVPHGDDACSAGAGAGGETPGGGHAGGTCPQKKAKKVCKIPSETNRHVDKKKCKVRPV